MLPPSLMGLLLSKAIENVCIPPPFKVYINFLLYSGVPGVHLMELEHTRSGNADKNAGKLDTS